MAGKRRGRGEGSIEALPDGKFRAFLSAGFVADKDGKPRRRRISSTFDTKREAQAFLRRQLDALSKGELADAGRFTVGEWIDRWLAHYKGKVAASTYDHDQWRAERHVKPMIGHIPLGKLTALQVADMLGRMAEAGESTSERHKAGTVLRKALTEAVSLHLIPRNVAKDVKLPKVDRPEKIALERPQAVALLNAARPDRLAAYFDLALDSGMRPGELFALHWPDVNLDGAWVSVRQTLNERRGVRTLKEPKTKAGKRRVLIGKRTVEALRIHRERMQAEKHDVDAGPVFPSLRGGFLRRSNFLRRTFKPILAKAGLPAIRPYDLRHTSATLLLAADVNIKVVSMRLGHKSIEITLKHYVHALPSMQERAATAVDALFGEIGTTMARKGEEAKEVT